MQVFFVIFLCYPTLINGASNEDIKKLLENVVNNVSDYQVSVVFSQVKPRNGDRLIEVDAFGLNLHDESKIAEFLNVFAKANTNDLELSKVRNDNSVLAYFESNLDQTRFIEHLVNAALKVAKLKFQCYSDGDDILSHVIKTDVHLDKIAEIKINRVRNVNMETQRYIFKVTRYAFLTFRNSKYVLSIIKHMLNSDFRQYKWSVIKVNKFNKKTEKVQSHCLLEFTIKDTKLKIFGYYTTYKI